MDRKNKIVGIEAGENITDGCESEIPSMEKPQYTEQIIALIKHNAMEMTEQGISFKEVHFAANSGGSFYLSTESEKIVDPDSIQIDGSTFYFGIFNNND